MPPVFLVDDDASVRTALARVLRQGGWDVETHASAEDFLARPDPARYGCLVLDLSMPGEDGLSLQDRLTRLGIDLPIVFLTGFGDIPSSVRAVKAGAADFLTKPVGEAELVAAIRSALAQHELRHTAGQALALYRQRLAALTPREMEVLAAVASGRLNKQIAADLGVVEQTVKFHRARIMTRMQARTVAELMRMAARLGIGTEA